MRGLPFISIAILAFTAAAAAAPKPDAGNEFVLGNSETARDAHGAKPSKLKPTPSEAALRFFVIDKEKGPAKGVVVSLTAPDGKKYYTEESDAEGYAEVLVPNGQKYELVFLSLGRRDIAANVTVSKEPNQNVKLTLRYKTPPPQPRFVLNGVTFETGKAIVRAESYPRLDIVAEFMAHKRSARVEISGHTDNVGSAKINKALSLKRAQACRDYVVSKGIDGSRITAVGYGDERPVAPNDTDAGRQQNRRIEAMEM
jgi:outer membrane protein OmpA-like peptidoglycan-associated protein